MRLADFERVSALVVARDHILDQRESRAFTIVIDGKHDSDMVERVRHHINAELERRLLAVEQQLRSLGVALD